jgi:hypothetical protein
VYIGEVVMMESFAAKHAKADNNGLPSSLLFVQIVLKELGSPANVSSGFLSCC